MGVAHLNDGTAHFPSIARAAMVAEQVDASPDRADPLCPPRLGAGQSHVGGLQAASMMDATLLVST